MATDANLATTDIGTITTTTSSAGITFPKSNVLAGQELFLHAVYSAASNASGANTVVFSADLSTDGGGSWNELVGQAPISLSTTAQAGDVYLPLPLTQQSLINPSMSNAPQVRLTCTIAGAGSGPTITIKNIACTNSRL